MYNDIIAAFFLSELFVFSKQYSYKKCEMLLTYVCKIITHYMNTIFSIYKCICVYVCVRVCTRNDLNLFFIKKFYNKSTFLIINIFKLY